MTKSPVVRQRQVGWFTRLALFVRAGGRCQFDGCNKYLLHHSLTLRDGNFAQVAHIVAFSPSGPRGRSGVSTERRNELGNLMLLCPECHKLIDDHPADYTVKTLRRYKQKHEDRIRRLTEMKPDYQTKVVLLQASVGNRAVAIPMVHVREAVAPRYPDEEAVWLDFTGIADGGDEAYWTTARRTIDERISQLYSPRPEDRMVHHISVFALAPIPLLVHLGSRLSDKIPVDVYQRHRDTEDWTWKSKGEPVQYSFEMVRAGTDPSKAALLISLSGKVTADSLPQVIDSGFTLYEISLVGAEPNPRFLRLRQDLVGFESTYDGARRHIMAKHPALEVLHLFPAVPAPIAVACGRALLQKIDPCLLVYDYDKARGGFTRTIRINDL
jgi:hypothetical protein